jgi:tRNA nucleotidyltransferase (CCA-adding enzyme)
VEFSLPFDLAILPEDTYLVGGAVRDALLGRSRPVPDLDLIVPVDAVALASQIADREQAGFVLLDAERSIARVVFPEATVDFAQQIGGSLSADLRRRDYCMNAIACHIKTGEIVDPLDGRQDLADRLVRMVAAENLREDPLRLLRGYRQAAQLGFQIEPATARAIESLATLLPQAATERVLTELRYLLNSRDSSMLAAAIQLLSSWWPAVVRPELELELATVNAAYDLVAQRYPALGQELLQPLRPTLSVTGLDIALLAQILKGRESTLLLTKLSASRAEIDNVAKAIKYSDFIIENDVENNYKLFQGTGKLLPIVVILKIATSILLTTLASDLAKDSLDQSEEVLGGSAIPEAIGHTIERYLDPQDPLAHPIPLINGTELMRSLGLSPSPVIGQLLQSVQLAQVRGEVMTKQEAVIFAQAQLDGNGSPKV